MFRERMPLEDKWEENVSKEFSGIRPQEGYTATDLTNRIAEFVMDAHSINVTGLLVRGGFREKADIDRIAETGWDYAEGNSRQFEINGTYLLKFHHMPYIHLFQDQFLNPLTHLCLHMHEAPALVFYDPEQMIRGEGEGCREFGKYLFADPGNKRDAVVGIIEFDIQESRDAQLMRILSQIAQRNSPNEER